MAEEISVPAQDATGNDSETNAPTKETSNRPAFKVKAMKVPPSQQRLEVRAWSLMHSCNQV